MALIRVADYVFSRLKEWGTRHVFLVTGGGAMHLNDALAGSGLDYICHHHEQAAAMAAEAYARVTGVPGVLSVTTGPGGINALNGVFGAWTDSIPMLVVSGQVKRETCMRTAGTKNLRQLGDQEVDIVNMARGITKYAVMVDDPASIRYHLERAWHLAVSGRPGPCWIDIPVDVQASKIDSDDLRAYDPSEDPESSAQGLAEHVAEVLRRIKNAERPVIMVGTGVRLAGATDLLKTVAEKLGIPVTTAFNAHDCLPTAHPLYCGRPGSVGDRAGNFTAQNSDLLLVLGCRLNIRQISYTWKYFAHSAFKIQVDIDAAELNKPTVKPDLAIVADVKQFLTECARQLDAAVPDSARHGAWVAWCKERVERYDPRKAYPEISHGQLNPYFFVHSLSSELADDDVIVCGDGMACLAPFQVVAIRGQQRMFSNSGAASMGYDLPAAIGAAVARGGGRVICFGGDGSLHMNIQELQTALYHRLNLKIFVINNGGYLSMRQTQQGFFGRLIGESPRSGVSFPNYASVAAAYGLGSWRLDAGNYRDGFRKALATEGPVLCEVMVDPEQAFEPKLSSRTLPDGRMVSSPLEDLSPFLDRDEFASNMLVPLVEE
jgi:acetolactate synthase-1/2/3 large subunit